MPVSSSVLAGRYELGDLLGRGGMGEVHRAWDRVLDRAVAVKLVRGGGDPDVLRRFEHEVRALAGLTHPGLVSVFDAGTHGSVSFVVMGLVEGSTLRAEMASGPMTVECVRDHRSPSRRAARDSAALLGADDGVRGSTPPPCAAP